MDIEQTEPNQRPVSVNENAIDEEQDPVNQEDEAWRMECVRKFAADLIEEAKLKQIVISKERELLEKSKKLETLKISFLTDLENEDAHLNGEVTFELTEYEKQCIESLEKRIEYLQQRAEKLQNELLIANRKEANETGNFVAHDQGNLLVQENINDILYENKTLEKYIRSENFRIFDENIGCQKFNLDQLKKKLSEIVELRVYLEKSEQKKRDFLQKLQKKFKALSDD
jgi:hypothetical protein